MHPLSKTPLGISKGRPFLDIFDCFLKPRERIHNSRSCEGATRWLPPHRRAYRISTHAPVKERHLACECVPRLSVISTHAPVKERRGDGPAPHGRRHFNSRSCDGATGLRKISCTIPAISTHAPVKERQQTDSGRRHRQSHFNSRSCEGATPRSCARHDRFAISTHAPVKERRAIHNGLGRQVPFQLTLL